MWLDMTIIATILSHQTNDWLCSLFICSVYHR